MYMIHLLTGMKKYTVLSCTDDAAIIFTDENGIKAEEKMKLLLNKIAVWLALNIEYWKNCIYVLW